MVCTSDELIASVTDTADKFIAGRYLSQIQQVAGIIYIINKYCAGFFTLHIFAGFFYCTIETAENAM